MMATEGFKRRNIDLLINGAYDLFKKWYSINKVNRRISFEEVYHNGN